MPNLGMIALLVSLTIVFPPAGFIAIVMYMAATSKPAPAPVPVRRVR